MYHRQQTILSLDNNFVAFRETLSNEEIEIFIQILVKYSGNSKVFLDEDLENGKKIISMWDSRTQFEEFSNSLKEECNSKLKKNPDDYYEDTTKFKILLEENEI